MRPNRNYIIQCGTSSEGNLVMFPKWGYTVFSEIFQCGTLQHLLKL